jgi:predicted nuclease of predicted toxin-antitoxin system
MKIFPIELKSFFKEDFDNVVHVSDVNLLANKDMIIFEYAKNNHFDLLITFDEDYKHLVLLKNIPPKIVVFKTGNLSTKKIAALLISKKQDMIELINDPEESFLEIF